MRGYVGNGHFHLPEDVIGRVSNQGSELSGIAEGAEVICGCDDLTAGVIGLGAVDGVLFNLANTSEHVGLVGSVPREDMSWLPPIGRLPSLCYNATSTDANTIMRDRMQAVEDVRSKFPAGEMWIGGGWAMNSQLVASRSAIRKAGQEVSALGVAKLAHRRPVAVIFGAGKVGRGFLAQLLNRAGWDFSLVDSHEDTVNALRQQDGWNVYNLMKETNERLQARHIWHFDDNLDEVLAEADLMLTAMGANRLKPWAHQIRKPLCKRLRDGKIDLILAENHPRPAAEVREALLDGADDEESQLINTRLGIAQAQVLRSCIEPTVNQHPLTVQVQDHWTLPLDGEALRTEVSIEGFEKKTGFARELTRKLFTYNCVNAMVCYIGYLSGYEWLADAANDPNIAELALQAGRESSAALVAAYGFEADEQEIWCNQALEKYQDESIRDPIERNARDPVRKLGKTERLLGPIHLCIEHNLPHQTLMIGVAAALRYPGAIMENTLPTGEAEARLESLLAQESL
jgi:mannitol-1-phosphate 5-dehydrogenase